MSRPRKIQNIDEENSEMDSKTHIYSRTISRKGVYTETGAVPSEVVEKELDEWKGKGYKLSYAFYAETNPEGHTVLFVLEKE